MPEAVISYRGPMPTQGPGPRDLHPFMPCFAVEIADERVFRVHTELTAQGSHFAIRRLELTGPAPLSPDQAHETLNNALQLYAVRRLEPLTMEWLSTGTRPVNPSEVWTLTSEDVWQP